MDKSTRITPQIQEKQTVLVLKGLLVLVFGDGLQGGERDGGWRGGGQQVWAAIATSCLTVTTSCPATAAPTPAAAYCGCATAVPHNHLPFHALNPHLHLLLPFLHWGCWARGMGVRDHGCGQRRGRSGGGDGRGWRGRGLRGLRSFSNGVTKTGQRGAQADATAR